jgi:hypothetical protein
MDPTCFVVTSTPTTPTAGLQDIKNAQYRDPELRPFIEYLKTGRICDMTRGRHWITPTSVGTPSSLDPATQSEKKDDSTPNVTSEGSPAPISNLSSSKAATQSEKKNKSTDNVTFEGPPAPLSNSSSSKVATQSEKKNESTDHVTTASSLQTIPLPDHMPVVGPEARTHRIQQYTLKWQKAYRQRARTAALQDDVLYYVTRTPRGGQIWRLEIPVSHRYAFMQLFHDVEMAAHGGITATLHRMRSKVHWIGMDRDVQQYVSTCGICQRQNPCTTPRYLVRIPR